MDFIEFFLGPGYSYCQTLQVVRSAGQFEPSIEHNFRYDNSVALFPQEGRGFGSGGGRKKAENNKSPIHILYAKQALNESFKCLF